MGTTGLANKILTDIIIHFIRKIKIKKKKTNMTNYIRSHNNNCMEVKDLKIKENKEILFGEPVNNQAQSWALTSLGDGSGFCTIDIAGTGYCLEIKNSKVKN